ncbi:MAG TPA: hypothetical protein DEF06_07360 [Clostridiales bacterium]|nr:hypothetical protein [Clostridiales bacterium]
MLSFTAAGRKTGARSISNVTYRRPEKVFYGPVPHTASTNLALAEGSKTACDTPAGNSAEDRRRLRDISLIRAALMETVKMIAPK